MENLTRQQKRLKERKQSEAMSQLQKFIDKFTDAVINCDDPENDEINQLAKRMDAQWRLFCKYQGLTKESFSIFKNHSTNLINDYKKNIEGVADLDQQEIATVRKG